MPIYPYRGVWPTIAADAFVAPTAVIVGDVTLEAEASVWFGAVVRGDMAAIRIGARANVQDNCVLHTDEGYPCLIGAETTLGHGAIVHGARVGERVLIGMHATVLNGAVIGAECVVAAGALVAEGKQIPAGQTVMGVPGKVVRPTTEDERRRARTGAEHYAENGRVYAAMLRERPSGEE